MYFTFEYMFGILSLVANNVQYVEGILTKKFHKQIYSLYYYYYYYLEEDYWTTLKGKCHEIFEAFELNF